MTKYRIQLDLTIEDVVDLTTHLRKAIQTYTGQSLWNTHQAIDLAKSAERIIDELKEAVNNIEPVY